MTITELGTRRTYEDLRDDFMLCRTLRHAWEEVVEDTLERPQVQGDWWWVLRCSRCQTKRIILVDVFGNYVRLPRYVYPDGYQLDEKVTSSELRVEWAKRHSYGAVEQQRTKRKKK